jgi:hypothetical protein
VRASTAIRTLLRIDLLASQRAYVSLSHRCFDISYREITWWPGAGLLLHIAMTSADLGRIGTCRALYLTLRDGFGFMRQADVYIVAKELEYPVISVSGALGKGCVLLS